MAIMAHPDDIEFCCAATIAKWTAEGQQIVFVLGTSGDKGGDDPSVSSELLMETREAEQREAARILGVTDVVFLRLRDAEVVADLETRKKITRVIRQYKPDAVICMDPASRYTGDYLDHPDHIAIGEATLAAIYPSARDRLTFPELLAEGLEPHKVKQVYLAVWGDRADHFEDVTGFLDKKVEALRAHYSQIGEWNGLDREVERWARDGAALARHKEFPDAEAMEYAEHFKLVNLGY
jgi:LmbE family N-acetylglucosaminyl deacetylase